MKPTQRCVNAGIVPGKKRGKRTITEGGLWLVREKRDVGKGRAAYTTTVEREQTEKEEKEAKRWRDK